MLVRSERNFGTPQGRQHRWCMVVVSRCREIALRGSIKQLLDDNLAHNGETCYFYVKIK